MLNALLWAAAGTGFTALMTALGSAVVFLFRHRSSPALHRIMLGFAAGVMIAASMWSLLIPAIEKAQEMGLPGWLPAAGGSVLGIGFLLAMDYLLPHLTPESFHLHNSPSRTALLVLAVTLHNIPEGMAVGVSFALAAQSGDPALLTAISYDQDPEALRAFMVGDLGLDEASVDAAIEARQVYAEKQAESQAFDTFSAYLKEQDPTLTDEGVQELIKVGLKKLSGAR